MSAWARVKRCKATKTQFWFATRLPGVSKLWFAVVGLGSVGLGHGALAYSYGMLATVTASVMFLAAICSVILMMSRAYLPLGNGAYLYVAEPGVWGVHLLRPVLDGQLPRPSLLVESLAAVWPYVQWGRPQVFEISSPLLVRMRRGGVGPHGPRLVRLEGLLRDHLSGLGRVEIKAAWLNSGNSLLVLLLNKGLRRLVLHAQRPFWLLVRLPSATLRFEVSDTEQGAPDAGLAQSGRLA